MHTAKLHISVTTVYELALPVEGEDLVNEIDAVIRAVGWDPAKEATLLRRDLGCTILHVTGHPVVVQWREHVDSGPQGRRWSGRHISLMVGHDREALSVANIMAFLYACEDQGLKVLSTEGGVGAPRFHVCLAKEISQETFMAIRDHLSEDFATPPADLTDGLRGGL